MQSAIETLNVEFIELQDEELRCHCPWPENHKNADADGSFFINARTGLWICFTGCGSGTLPLLVRRILELDQEAAARWLVEHGRPATFELLGEMLHAPLLQPVPGPDSVGQVAAIAEADYSMQATDRTSSYIFSRGYTVPTLKSWGFRYDPRQQAIVVPIRDLAGKLVANYRRRVPPVAPGFPPHHYTPGFKRDRILFGAYRHPQDGTTTYLVEGVLDCVWLHQCGYPGAVAMMGAYLSAEQARLLQKISRQVVIVPDNDTPGIEAANRLMDQLDGLVTWQLAVVPHQFKDVQQLSEAEVHAALGDPIYGWERAK